MTRIVLNILGFQVAWWACVLSARGGAAWIGLGITALVVVLHLLFAPARGFESWFIPLAAAIGYAVDTAATWLGALAFETRAGPALPAPLWVAALWLAFATTLNTTFACLRDHPLIAAGLGAASGPLAYAAGAALGVVTLPNPLHSVLVLGVLWGATLPALVLIARYTAPRPHAAAPATAPQGAGETT